MDNGQLTIDNGLELVGYHLVDGKYEDLEPNDSGHLWSQQLQLGLGVHDNFVRFFTPEGELVPTPEEDAERSQQQVLQAQHQAEIEREKYKKVAAKLRELNIDPSTL